jgi:hypothetical protein
MGDYIGVDAPAANSAGHGIRIALPALGNPISNLDLHLLARRLIEFGENSTGGHSC